MEEEFSQVQKQPGTEIQLCNISWIYEHMLSLILGVRKLTRWPFEGTSQTTVLPLSKVGMQVSEVNTIGSSIT